MNVFRVNFQELYRRHLCRHSQFGLNVWHLIAVVGIYFSLYGVAFALPGAPWIVGSVLAFYFLILAFNVPVRRGASGLRSGGCGACGIPGAPPDSCLGPFDPAPGLASLPGLATPGL